MSIVAVVFALIFVVTAAAAGKLCRRSRDVVASALAARLVDAGETMDAPARREVVVVPSATTMEETCQTYDDAAGGVERGSWGLVRAVWG